MELDGTLIQNLEAALASMARLRDRPVYADTLQFWHDLLHLARSGVEIGQVTPADKLGLLIGRIEAELAQRG